MDTNMKKLYFRRALTKKSRPPKRLPVLLYPSHYEQRYANLLDDIVRFTKGKIDEHIKPLLPKLVKHYGRARTDAADAPRKYYLAFIYDGSWAQAEVLHCTHKYLGELSREDVKRVEAVVDNYFIEKRELPRVAFTKRDLFGPEKNIPVLRPEDPEAFDSFYRLHSDLELFRDDEYPFSPHVTTEAERVDRPFSYYALISKTGIHRTWPKSIRSDAPDEANLDDLATQLEKVRLEVTEEYSPEELRRLAVMTGRSVADFNASQLSNQMGAVVEIDLFGSEPWLAREMGAFVAQNVSLITSIPDEYLGQVEKLVATSVRSGLRSEEIAAELEDRYDVAKSRAELIARDQVGKFNGQLTEARQKDLGVEKYRWKDSGDARVRESHRENAKRDVGFGPGIYAWDDPPDTGHPGEDFQCRCWAEPVLDDFFGDE